MYTVGYYGIHWDDSNVAWLMQGRGSSNAYGLKQKPPFKVQLPGGRKHCNHQIPLQLPIPNDSQWNYLVSLIDDPLVQAALSLPKTGSGVYFVEDDDLSLMWYLSMLSTMSSPIYPCVMPRFVTREQAVLHELEQTNVQPYFIADLEASDSQFLSRMAKAAMAMPRKLILSGRSDVVVPQTVSRIRTSINDTEKHDPVELESLYWEGLGATLLRKYMRREPYGKDSIQRTGRKAEQARAQRGSVD